MKAKECSLKAQSMNERFGSLVQFADCYLEKRKEAEFHEVMKKLEVVAAELPGERVRAAMRIVGLKADWSLYKDDKASFEEHLSTMKQLVSQLSDPEMKEEAQEEIEEYEAEGMKRFSDVPLSMHSTKA